MNSIFIDTAVDQVLTFQVHDYAEISDATVEEVVEGLGAEPELHDAVQALTGAGFRKHLRVSQSGVLGKVLQGVHTSKTLVVTGNRGSGKSTFAGEICDALSATVTKPVYVNGDLIRDSPLGVDPPSVTARYSRQIERMIVSTVTRRQGGLSNEFIFFLAQNSRHFIAIQTIDQLKKADSARLHMEQSAHSEKWERALDSWSRDEPEAKISDVAAFFRKKGWRVALILDNHDGYDMDCLAAIGTLLRGVRANFGNSASIVLFLRPTSEEVALDALQYGATAERLRIEPMIEPVLRRRSEFLKSPFLLSGLREVSARAMQDAPTITPEIITGIEAAGANLSSLYREISASQIEFVNTKDYSVASRSALSVIAAWHNYNSREVARSMRTYRELYNGQRDRSTAVLRHLLTYGSSEPNLERDLQLLIPDADVYHSGLVHLRWRLLQFLARYPEKSFTAEHLFESLRHFEDDEEPIIEGLTALQRRAGLESGFVECDVRHGERVWSILPAGEWFISGICHTVEYMFMLALADIGAKQFSRDGRSLDSFADQERSEIAVRYVADVLVPHFRREHPYLDLDVDLEAMDIGSRKTLKEFSRLFGYGVRRGWFLSRFLAAFDAFNRLRMVELSTDAQAAKLVIQLSITRLDDAAEVAGVRAV